MGQALVVLMAWQREWNCLAGDYIPLICPITGDAEAAVAVAALSPASPTADARAQRQKERRHHPAVKIGRAHV
mgnify:CR=1 FL=1